jgi:hypothetical protein
VQGGIGTESARVAESAAIAPAARSRGRSPAILITFWHVGDPSPRVAACELSKLGLRVDASAPKTLRIIKLKRDARQFAQGPFFLNRFASFQGLALCVPAASFRPLGHVPLLVVMGTATSTPRLYLNNRRRREKDDSEIRVNSLCHRRVAQELPPFGNRQRVYRQVPRQCPEQILGEGSRSKRKG